MAGVLAWFTALPLAGKLVTGATALAVSGIVGAALVAPDPVPMAVVTNVVDGDTIDVRYEGEEQRVRLLNINTPETVDPDKDVECLGPEASDYLKHLLPAGTKVKLEFDQELHDRFGRLLAGVFLNGTLVNAEIARQGLGAAVLYEPNDRFYDEVEAASQEAFDAKQGLYDEAVECTLLGQMSAYNDAVVDASEQVPATVEEADILLNELAALALTATALREMVGAPHLFPAAAYSAKALAGWASYLDETDGLRDSFQQEVLAARDAEVQRIEAEHRAAEEAARVAAEAEAARVADEEAARVAAAEAARVAADKAAADAAAAEKRSAATPEAPAASSGSGGSAGGGDGGYTGCRKYAPGGKTWEPIPCP
ncbi:thermonuclease family protein [uncultured Cellulomonas sp.]|uniref:thermonuclease family protein n=1 Tax=uncultured Cellulomonas sp. TaxID=189682 RepID=UPI0028E86816|nr:thermonuclease family protein [uncultured Cellulomonas sp.]